MQALQSIVRRVVDALTSFFRCMSGVASIELFENSPGTETVSRMTSKKNYGTISHYFKGEFTQKLLPDAYLDWSHASTLDTRALQLQINYLITPLINDLINHWSSRDQPWSLRDQPWSTRDLPWSTRDQPWSTRDQPWSTRDQPWSTRDQPWSTPDQPCVTLELHSSIWHFSKNRVIGVTWFYLLYFIDVHVLHIEYLSKYAHNQQKPIVLTAKVTPFSE